MTFIIRLAPLDSQMAEVVRSWRNDWSVMRWCRQNDLISDWDQKRWFERQASDPTIQMYALALSFENGKETLAGVAGFTSIDHFNRRAEFSLYLRPDLHGKGHGKAALRVLLAHGFDNLGFNVIWGECFAENPAARMFESLGFVKEGTRRDFYWRDGRFIDAHLYSLKRTDWIASQSPSQSAQTSPSSSSPESAAL